MKSKRKSKFFKNYLNFLWLRPENAIKDTIRASAFREVLDKYVIKKDKILDISCGDGIFSFICAGGEFDSSVDAFSAIKNKNRSSKIDVFDHFNQNYKIKIKKKPIYQFDTGIDWKNSMLKKASKLNWYRNLNQHNNSKKFKYEDDSFDLIYSNSAYWVKDMRKHINEIIRITKPRGYIYLQMKFKNTYSKNLLINNTDVKLGKKFFKIIEGGRLATWRGILDKKIFEKYIKSQRNIKVVSFKPLFGDSFALLWDVGLRPLFQPMQEMVDKLNKKDYLNIKKNWVKKVFDLLEHFSLNYKPKKNLFSSASEYSILIQKNKNSILK